MQRVSIKTIPSSLSCQGEAEGEAAVLVLLVGDRLILIVSVNLSQIGK